MQHRLKILGVLIFTLIGGYQIAFAQTKPAVNTTTTTKYKTKIVPPKLKTSLGILTDTATVSLDQAKAVIGTGLKVTDDKNNTYIITHYQLLYKQKIMNEDEKTGKQFPSQKTVSQTFRQTPLSAAWVKRLQEDFAKGEEVLFFDIIVKNAQGQLFFAPSLKLQLK